MNDKAVRRDTGRRRSAASLDGEPRMLTARLGASLALTYDANASLPDRREAAAAAFVRW